MAKHAEFPEEVTTLGEAIRYLREKREMSLRSLAEAAGVSAPFLSDLERNRRSTDRIEQFAKALGVEPDVLQGFDTRLPSDVRAWISGSPGIATLLRELRDTGLSPAELRSAFRRLKR
jgi:transcriptional regulator with XRE-family HTH domain